MTRKARADKMCETLTEWSEKFDFLNVKELKTLIALIKKNADAINSSASTKFMKMVKDRQSVKFVGMTEKDFNEMMKKQIEEQKALFERAKGLTAEEVKHIEEVKKRTATARRKNDVSVDDYLK